MNRSSIALISLLIVSSSACAASEDLAVTLTAPTGFSVETLPFAVPNARQMALTDNGSLIVGTRRGGSVYAIQGALTEIQPTVVELFRDLTSPSGLTVHNGDLYIGAVSRIIQVPDIDANLTPNPAHRVITESLPDKTHHGWKYLKFGPDGKLYVPVGAPCNVCLSDDPRFASILQMDPATGSTKIWAHGIRNTVGFDWHPETGEMWFSDNGRDMLGDDVPSEELNVSSTAGQHFGFPYVHAGDIPDPEFGKQPGANTIDFVAPKVKIQAHSAVLGLTFYTATQFPEQYQGAIFLAEHGSWNRGEKVGYRVSSVRINDDGSTDYAPFVSGWLNGQSVSGRPNDVLVTPNGDLLISDDQQGVIHRVRYIP
jgi:glucose/arabinose dehydrogenase